MNILHGSWIPSAEKNFVQQGSFYLWLETTEGQRQRDRNSQRHPRQLPIEQFAGVLEKDLGIKPVGQVALTTAIVPQFVLLPSDTDRPLPSLELSRYLEDELPETADWQYWQVDGFRAGTSHPTTSGDRPLHTLIKLLTDLHFIALHNLTDLQLGADLLFWYHYTQQLRQILLKEAYIPALRYRSPSTAEPALPPDRSTNPPPSTKRTSPRARKTTSRTASKTNRSAASTTTVEGSAAKASFEIYGGWDIVSEDYETALKQYAAAMPLVCAAGFSTLPDRLQGHDRTLLLRHFSESLLQSLVSHTSFTAAFEKKVADTLLQSCVRPLGINQPLKTQTGLELYGKWQTWRDRLSRTQTDIPLTLGFQLHEPDTAAGKWFLEFLMASRQDPSLQVALVDYWDMSTAQQKTLHRQIGGPPEQQLLMSLGHAARIYPRLWEGMNTAQPIGISLDLEQAFEFLQESAWVLENAGYRVSIPAWWTPQGRQRAKIRLRASGRSRSKPTALNQGYFSMETLVDYQYELSIGGAPVSEKEWQQLVNAKSPLVQFRGQWMQLDQNKMQQMLEFWKTHQSEQGAMSLLEVMKLTANDEDEIELDLDRDQQLSEMLAKLQDKSKLEPTPDPTHFQGNLREYQKRGVSWLHYLEDLGLNGCLADDMGLGKSAQVIARLVQEREGGSPKKKRNSKSAASVSSTPVSSTPVSSTPVPPTLLIAPTSVVGNWQKEIEKFAPHLRSLVHHGSQRIQEPDPFQTAVQHCDVVITSFTLARKDAALLETISWKRIVVDEAQNIKNPKAAQTKAILKLQAPHRLALTGTPVENRLLDLWSIFNFLNPGYLGKESQFRQSFEIPIQKHNDSVRSSTLKKLVEPFILRRVKTDQSIIKDLPDKVEQKLYCNLTQEQASLYEAVVKDVEEKLRTSEGIQRKGLILATLLKLKQICNHPMQFLQDNSEFTPERSHKLDRLTEMVTEALVEKESMLIFTQFTELGDALEKYLKHILHCNTYYLHGGTPPQKRQRMIAEFQDPETEPSIFILSLKAGGVGITLTKANHVFHFDRWWNPAVEDQASDRAFRIGQKKNVFVHKFVAIGTLEERIDQMIEDKKKLAGAIVGSDESWLTELDDDAFKALISLSRSAILE